MGRMLLSASCINTCYIWAAQSSAVEVELELRACLGCSRCIQPDQRALQVCLVPQCVTYTALEDVCHYAWQTRVYMVRLTLKRWALRNQHCCLSRRALCSAGRVLVRRQSRCNVIRRLQGRAAALGQSSLLGTCWRRSMILHPYLFPDCNVWQTEATAGVANNYKQGVILTSLYRSKVGAMATVKFCQEMLLTECRKGLSFTLEPRI